jgi:hypothetical protein
MIEGTGTPGLIRSRFVAIIVLVLTGFVATQTVRVALHNPTRHPDWLFPLFFIRAQWIVLLVNVAFYAYLLWLCFVFFRIAQGKERVIVIGWFFGIVLYPIKVLVSGPAAFVIRYAEAAAMAAAFLVSLDICVRFFAPAKPQIQI